MGDLFYTNMYSVINQWSDFRVSKNLYRAYFSMQKSKSSSDTSKDDKTNKVDTSKLYNVAGSADKLSTVTSKVSSDYSALVKALAGDKESGTIDYDAAYKNASAFADSYNNMMSVIGRSGDATVSGKAQFMDSMTRSYARTLAKVGITINSEKGTLEIDEDTFRGASEADLKAVFTDKNSFGAFVNEQSQQLYKFSQSESYTKKSASASSTASSKASENKTYDVNGALKDLNNSGSILNLLT